jgi:hypothetical protein
MIREKRGGILQEPRHLTEGIEESDEKTHRTAGPQMSFRTGPLNSQTLFSNVHTTRKWSSKLRQLASCMSVLFYSTTLFEMQMHRMRWENDHVDKGLEGGDIIYVFIYLWFA